MYRILRNAAGCYGCSHVDTILAEYQVRSYQTKLRNFPNVVNLVQCDQRDNPGDSTQLRTHSFRDGATIVLVAIGILVAETVMFVVLDQRKLLVDQGSDSLHANADDGSAAQLKKSRLKEGGLPKLRVC